MSNEELLEQQLLDVFNYYGLPEPGYGDRAFRCPVHDDRVASASVNRHKGVWHCHACGAGGTAVNLVMGMENLEFKEAQTFMANLTTINTVTSARPQRRATGRWVPPRLRGAS